MSEVVQIVEGQTGRVRARVSKIKENLFRVEIERLLDADDAGGVKHGEFWSPVSGICSFVGDLESAAKLAAEMLENTPTEFCE